MEMLGGSCPHCEWQAVAESYAKIVELYQRHLRAEHPEAWMRS